MIERKKLSPEARKQTRASESLKMTSKSQLYVSHRLVNGSSFARFVGQNRLPYLGILWNFSIVLHGQGNVLRALYLSRIGSLPSPLAQFGQGFACSIRRLETSFRVLFSTRIPLKSIKTMHSMIWENRDPFKKNKRSADQQKWYSNVWAMKSDLVYALSKSLSDLTLTARPLTPPPPLISRNRLTIRGR